MTHDEAIEIDGRRAPTSSTISSRPSATPSRSISSTAPNAPPTSATRQKSPTACARVTRVVPFRALLALGRRGSGSRGGDRTGVQLRAAGRRAPASSPVEPPGQVARVTAGEQTIELDVTRAAQAAATSSSGRPASGRRFRHSAGSSQPPYVCELRDDAGPRRRPRRR